MHLRTRQPCAGGAGGAGRLTLGRPIADAADARRIYGEMR